MRTSFVVRGLPLQGMVAEGICALERGRGTHARMGKDKEGEGEGERQGDREAEAETEMCRGTETKTDLRELGRDNIRQS